MAHILPHWNWPERMGQVTPVHVYTSGDEAELFLNGVSLGRKKKEPFQYRLRWDDVQYAPGELVVRAYKNGKAWAQDRMSTAGAAAKLELSAERTTMHADGKDLVFISVAVVDREGRTVPTASAAVRFSVRGPAAILAVANGDPTSHDPFTADRCRTFHGRSLVVLRSSAGKSGQVTVTADAEGVAGGEVTVVVE
jgi:beta-galactosidase